MGARVAGRRRCAAVVAVVACLELLGAVDAAAAPAPTASPTPCGHDVAGVVCSVGAPGGSGGLQPGPRSSPSPSPAPAPARHVAPPPPPPPAAGPRLAPTAAPTPSPDAGLSLVAASLRTAPYAGPLLDVLAHPAAAARPDLRHFRPPDDAATVAVPAGVATVAGTPPPPARGAGRGGLLVGLLVVALAVALPLRHLLARPRSWLLVAIAAAVLPASTDASLAALAARHRAETPPPPLTTALGHRSETPPGPPPARTPAIWARLVGIERQLSDGAGLLAAQEWEIRGLAAVVGRHLDDPDQLPVGEASPVQERTRLAGLLRAHDAATAAYHQDLQAEYALYRGAAGDPGRRDELTAAAAAFPTPDAPVAVNANLGLLATQLAQEAAFATAQERLRQLGALLPAQLAAIRHHKPFIAPEIAPVSQGFGPTDLGIEPPLLYQGTFYPHFHTGIDLAAPEGTPLHAAADGVVLLAAASVDAAGRLVGYGNYVIVGHAAGFLTLYGHMSDVAVHAGDRVRQGQVVGFEGSTGNSTGPHVHFEVRRGGALLDPAPLLAGQLPPG